MLGIGTRIIQKVIFPNIALCIKCRFSNNYSAEPNWLGGAFLRKRGDGSGPVKKSL
jgi:hypothetical protein